LPPPADLAALFLWAEKKKGKQFTAVCERLFFLNPNVPSYIRAEWPEKAANKVWKGGVECSEKWKRRGETKKLSKKVLTIGGCSW